MASSDVEVANLGLTMLGDLRITSLDDDTKPAREAKAVYTLLRDKLLGAYNWSFAMRRTRLSPLAQAPDFVFAKQFLLPVDCLRFVMVAEQYVGVSLEDYRGQPNEDFVLEGRNLLCDLENPLRLRYITKVTDPSLFPSYFAFAFAAELAFHLAEPLTQSGGKKDRAAQERDRSISLAVRANAIELPPKKLADDEWILSRL